MDNVVAVGEQDFQDQVVEGSRQRPVVVDFWAGWCQPCLILSPMLERLAEEYEGRFLLATVDVDANPSLARTFGIQGIPAVKALRDGQIVSEFVGVQPEEALRRFLDELAPGEDELAAAREAESSGDTEAAVAAYREVVERRPDHAEAAAGLARVLLAGGAHEQARAVLAPLARSGEVARVVAHLDLRELAVADGKVGAAGRRLLGGERRQGLHELLSLLHDPTHGEQARRAMVVAFEWLGDEDPLTREFRPQLARALF
jgi:putative thioredoxin